MRGRWPELKVAVSAAVLASGLAATLLVPADSTAAGTPVLQPALTSQGKPILVIDGLRFRDLLVDGRLQPFEDWRLPPERRAADLAARMTLPEKAGVLMHATLPGSGGPLGRSPTGYDMPALEPLVLQRHINSFITRLALPAAQLAEANNAVQALAAGTRLGIPVTISTDPRHHFQYVLGASVESSVFTQWPEPLGFGALDDAALVKRFGDIARQEYRAVGIHMALSPQADLATEPRWPRATATFGSDPARVSRLAGAYVQGFQGAAEGLAANGVAAVVKHWVGYGAAPEGYDAHNYYGRFAQLDPGVLDLHVQAFGGALAARAEGVMPSYPIPVGAQFDGRPLEAVATGFNAQMLQGMLRGAQGHGGMILSDWAITRDCGPRCRAPTAAAPQDPPSIATSWGMEDASADDRYVKGLEAGLDQFGGVDEAGRIVQLVHGGRVTEARVTASVQRVLRHKFVLGLFENPFVDPDAATAVVGRADFKAEAARVQREAQVLLQDRGGWLARASGLKRVWLHGMAAEAAQAAGLEVVADPAQAEFAIVRAEAPRELLHPHHFFGARQNEGRLDYRDGDAAYEAVKSAARHVPVVFAVFLDRPAILGNLQDQATVILGNFGATDAAVLDVVLGQATARGRLPFELPASMAAVEAQHPGLPDDSGRPLYPAGFSAQAMPVAATKGPHAVLMTREPTLPEHTVFRPADLAALPGPLPLVAFGNGGCANIGNRYQAFLAEVASHGYVVTAPGPIMPPADRPPTGAQDQSRPRQMQAALDWAAQATARPGSGWTGRLDLGRLAVMGQSCGGLEAIAAGADARLKTVVVLNSGIIRGGIPNPDGTTRQPRGYLPASVADLAGLHTPTLYLAGGPRDQAWASAEEDFQVLQGIPLFNGNLDVGHGGTWREPGGGVMGAVAIDWLQWQLRGDAAAGRRFTGADCGLCRDPAWIVKKKGIDTAAR
ncbi:MAG: hypothetical protein RL026_101 [Pseudomonadota bacterium]